MVEKLLKLRQQFHVKTLQIEALVAKKHGSAARLIHTSF